MFREGDKILCVSTCDPRIATVGEIYEVTDVFNDRVKQRLVYFIGNDGTRSGMFPSRFALAPIVPLPTEFNVSTATDQELADEYRRLVACKAPIGKALLERDYRFYNNAGTPIKILSDFTISKTVKTVL